MSVMCKCNVVLVTIGIALVVVRISQWLYRWSNPNFKCNGKLPPGSMGFPIIGETFEFFKPCGFLEIPAFFQNRILRYGSLFRTNIMGSKTVIATDADVIFEIFRQENKSFVLSYPDVFVRVLGKDNLFFKTGNIHNHIKKTTMHLIGSVGLKRKMIESMNQATREHLRQKASEGTFDLRDAVSSLIASYMTPKLISDLKPETQAKLIDHLKAFNIDWFRSPFAPSTWKIIYKVLKARREATQVIKEALEKRKESGEKHGDFLDTLLEELEKEGSIYDQASVINLLLIIGVVSKDTTSISTALMVNLLSKNPKVLAELKREHEAILQKRSENKEAGVKWEEYKYNMTFTRMVISETLRLSNLGSILFRKAVEDVEIKGYTIPAGWIVAVAPSVVHYNSEIYENPLEFNPWRWEGKDLRSVSKSLMVFGGGTRQCVGVDFARLHMTIFLHHLVTTYDFSVVQESEMIRTPLPCFTKDLLINISPSLPSEHCSSMS
uniref:Cytochrome P450 708A3-1 n=1 Tax=Isatis tinctoria TaxID=161756 RepID=A0A8F0FRR9_ISATI|nr:cytochrome P450 708A3-1 [Isatis tinctoria]